MSTTVLRRQPLKSRRILIAEDELMVGQTIRMALAVDGHTVDVAEDGLKALAMFEAGKHDLVITDFKMSNMDGLELAESVKKRSPATPVILITAYAETVTGKGGPVSNVDFVLGKPFSIMQLHAAVEQVLGH